MKTLRYHILLALADGPLHGAEIRRRSEEESGGAVTLYPATLYGTLDGMQAAGWIREVDMESAEPDQARWRFYALTSEGRAALEAETDRLEAVVGRARALLGGASGG
jgi:PadR family transcriptional regulator, regulatory protein PadR